MPNVTLPGDGTTVATVTVGGAEQQIVQVSSLPAVALDATALAALANAATPATQPVSIASPVPVTGALTDSELRAVAVPVSLAVAPTTPVTGVFWQATQPVSGPLTDAQLRAAAVTVGGSVSVSNMVAQGLTDTELRAAPVPVSGAVSVSNMVAQGLTDAQLRATEVPTAPTGQPSAYWPSYSAPTSTGSQVQLIDTGGALVTRGAILTDEGTFRANFANNSLAVAIGECTVSGNVVTGVGFDASDVHLKDYFKFDADAEAAWTQIDSIDSPTQITLVSAYVGSATGQASRALMRPTTGAGGSITVLNGQCVMTSGTTSGSRTILSRVVDYAPLVYRQRVSVSQRVANQNVRIGFSESSPTPRWFARFRMEGATNTVIACETGRNPTQAPSAAETETTSVLVPFGKTTAQMLDLRIEQLVESVRFYIDNVLVAEHSKALPSAYDVMVAGTLIENTGIPASSTTVTVDYVTSKNHNRLEIGVMSESEKILASQVPMQPFGFTQAGVIATNTDLIVVDCSQLRTLSIQCTSMGTTGVVTPAWSNDGVSYVTAVLLSESGAPFTTFNAAVLRMTNVMARYFRLRMSTATTAGTTTIFLNGSQMAQPPIVSTQAVSGTVTATVTNGTVTNTPVTPNATFVNSAATTNAQIIKASAGTLWSVVASNTNAATRFLKLHNVATLPVPGTTAVALTVAIPSGGTVTFNGGANGIRFGTGIGQSITASAADADATAVALGDVKVAWSFT
jgi:hypothetical protein